MSEETHEDDGTEPQRATNLLNLSYIALGVALSFEADFDNAISHFCSVGENIAPRALPLVLGLATIVTIVKWSIEKPPGNVGRVRRLAQMFFGKPFWSVIVYILYGSSLYWILGGVSRGIPTEYGDPLFRHVYTFLHNPDYYINIQ